MQPIDRRPAPVRPPGRISLLMFAILVATIAPAPAAASSWPTSAAGVREPVAVPAAAALANLQAPAPAPIRSAAPTPSAAPATTATAPTAGLHREVFGFLPYWELADPSLRLRYGLLSTIAYFSVGVGADGGLKRRDAAGRPTAGWAGWTSSRMTSVIASAHRNHARVVLTLSMFAWTSGGAAAQARLLDDPAARRRLAREAAQAVHDRKADGLNLDFEPLVAGHEDGFVALVREIRAQLDRTKRGYQLTFDTMGRVGNYPIAAATGRGGADAVFIMAYDYRTSGSAVAGSIAPLSGPQYDLADTLLTYLEAVPASRIILGVGWYGRAWPTVSDDLNASTLAGARYGGSNAVPYAQVVTAASGRPVRWDAREGTAWFAYRRETCSGAYGCVSTWRQVYYDDVRALRLKYDLVNLAGIRGVGIWALGYEGSHSEVWTAIADKFARDTTPPRAAIRVLASEQRDEGFVVDWSGWDDRSGIAGYDVQVSVDGGPWRGWLKQTTSGADVWLGRDGHAYQFRVRARDGRGNVGAWSTASPSAGAAALRPGSFARVLVDGLNARERPSPTATRRDTLAAGTLVSITDAPVASDGVTWVAVREPIAEWPPVSLVHTGVWVAASDAATGTLLQPVPPPDSTRVVAGISGVAFGGVGAPSIGPGVQARSRRAFSPNGDGSQDTLRIDWHARVAFDALTLRVFSSRGKLLGSRPIASLSAGDRSFAWDGAVGGRTLKDGSYLLQLVGTAAGLTYTAPSARPVTPAQVAAYAVTIDTTAPTAGPRSLTGRRLSPNGDGRHDTVILSGSATGADRWSFTAAPIVDGKIGAAVRSMAGTGGEALVSWDGRADDGSVVPDGRYRVTIRNLDWAGNGPKAAWTVPVDSRAPRVSLEAAPAVVSPDGDGMADRAAISWTSDERATGRLVVRRGGSLVRILPLASGIAGTVAWDGRDSAGRTVADGRYAVTAELTDAAGNRAASSTPVVIDRPVASLAWSADAFDPLDGDSLSAGARLALALTKDAAVSLRIEDAAGALVRRVWDGRAETRGRVGWTWDGRDGHHALVPPGRYTAVLTVATALGTTGLRRAIVVDAFIVPGLPDVVRAGGFLTLWFRSVEALRSAPTITVVQNGATVSRVRAVAAGGGRYLATVRIGSPGPVSIVIAARDSAGGTNVSRLSTRAK